MDWAMFRDLPFLLMTAGDSPLKRNPRLPQSVLIYTHRFLFHVLGDLLRLLLRKAHPSQSLALSLPVFPTRLPCSFPHNPPFLLAPLPFNPPPIPP